jgi:hypothetical protein
MVTHYDDKGKIFTQVVAKHPVQVIIQTIQNMIRGTIYIRPDSRVKDDLDVSERFLAVTKAVVYNSQNEVIYQSDFLVVNTSHIIWVIPEEEINT